MERDLFHRVELRQLLYFTVVAAERSFTRAAEVLSMGQPGLSSQVKKLEDALGIALFQRTARGVLLTEAGEQFLGYAQQILSELKMAGRVMDELREVTTGQVILGVTVASTFSHLSAILQEYRRLYPQVYLKIVELPTEMLIEQVRVGLVDLTLAVLPAEVEELVIEPLFTENLRLLVSAHHPLADRARQGRPVELPELVNEPLILPYRHYGIREQVEAAYRQFNLSSQTVIDLMGVGVAVQLVRNGQGITFLPEKMVEDEVRLGEIVCLTIHEPILVMSTGLLYRRNQYLPPASRRMIEVIRRVCQIVE